VALVVDASPRSAPASIDHGSFLAADLAPRKLDAEQAKPLVELKAAQDGSAPFFSGLTGQSEQEIRRQDAGKVIYHTDQSTTSSVKRTKPAQG